MTKNKLINFNNSKQTSNKQWDYRYKKASITKESQKRWIFIQVLPELTSMILKPLS